MIIDTRGRKDVRVAHPGIPAPKKKPADESVAVGDDVEVEVKRNGRTLYKGR